MAETAMGGGQEIAQIPTNAASQFISMAPNAINTGVGALSTAAGLDTTRKGTYTPSFWDSFMQGVQVAANPGGAKSSRVGGSSSAASLGSSGGGGMDSGAAASDAGMSAYGGSSAADIGGASDSAALFF